MFVLDSQVFIDLAESGTTLRVFEHIVFEVRASLDTQFLFNFTDHFVGVNLAGVVILVDLKQAGIL